MQIQTKQNNSRSRDLERAGAETRHVGQNRSPRRLHFETRPAVLCLLETGGRPAAFRNEAVEEIRSEEHTSELQSQSNLVCRLLLEKKKNITTQGFSAAHSKRIFVTFYTTASHNMVLP